MTCRPSAAGKKSKHRSKMYPWSSRLGKEELSVSQSPVLPGINLMKSYAKDVATKRVITTTTGKKIFLPYVRVVTEIIDAFKKIPFSELAAVFHEEKRVYPKLSPEMRGKERESSPIRSKLSQ